MKNLVFLLMVVTAVVIGGAQTKQKKETAHKEPVNIVMNNSKVLTATGVNLIDQQDIISVRVRHDSIFFTLKEDALKKLDANPEKNYKQAEKKTASK